MDDIMSASHQVMDIHVSEIAVGYPLAPQPENCRIPLKPHQLALLQRCIDFEREKIMLNNYEAARKRLPSMSENDHVFTHVGIIGDKVGAGKSYVVLGLIMSKHNTERRQFSVEAFGSNKVIAMLSDNRALYNTNVVVIPHTILHQWETYVSSFCPHIQYATVFNQKQLDVFARDITKLGQFDCVFLGSNYHNAFARLLDVNTVKIRRAIYDEVDSMSIPNSVEMPCFFYWFVTASFGNLLYPQGFRHFDTRTGRSINYATGIRNNGFIKNVFTDVFQNKKRRDIFSALVLKNKDDFVDSSFYLQDPEITIIKCKETRTIHLLSGLVERNIMDCLNAGDEQAAIELIDPRRKNNMDNLMNILIQKYMDDLHNIHVQINAVSQMTFMNEGERDGRIKRLEERKTTLEAKVQSVRDRLQNTHMCCICYDNMTTKTITKCCNNAFCFACIHTWLNLHTVCPLCKAHMQSKDLYVVENRSSEEIAEKQRQFEVEHRNAQQIGVHNDKFQNLLLLLKQREPHSKFLIFSNYENTFNNMADVLHENGMRFGYMKGTRTHLDYKLNEYRSGNLDILLVNGSSYGCGLNLENTTHVVMFHKCDTELEKQVIGRAQRVGRKSVLKITYLLHENEVQEEVAPAITVV